MKILFVTDLIPIEENENCAKALVPIVKELSVENEVDIIRPNFILNSLIRGKTIKEDGFYEVNGLKIHNLNFHTPFLFNYKAINLNDYDKVIAHMPSGILFVERLIKSLKYNRPEIVYAVHQSDIQVLKSFKYSLYFRNALKKAYLNCDKIICRSPHLKNKLLKLIPECTVKTSVKISNIPKKDFLSEEEMFSKIKTGSEIKFLTAANLIKRKNIHLLLKAFAKTGKSFSLEIAGDGKELPQLKKLTKKLNLEKNVTFLGKLAHDEVLSKMREANVFALPSVNETLGLVYLEAFASGCLVIGTKNTGIDGIFSDNINCFLCEPTVEGIAKVLEKTMNLTSDDFKNLLANRVIVEW